MMRGGERGWSRTGSALLLAVAFVVASCTGSEGSGGSPSPSASGTATGGTGSPTTAPVSTVARDLDVPWGLAFLPDGSALVAERHTARILRIPPGGGQPTLAATVPDVDTDAGEGGLLGLAVAPTYATDHLLYAYFTSPTDNRVVRFVPGSRAVPTPLVTGIARAFNHDGGRLAFGPDGLLYIGTGDARVPSRAQDRASLNGKILRIRPDGSVPADNPFPGSPVWSLGHRNVQGLAFDSAGRLWATEFGQNRWDEINLIEPGRNYGWPEVEGKEGDGSARYTAPLVVWPTSEASPSGCAVLGGVLYVGALRGERLWAVQLDGARVGTPHALLAGELGRIRTVVAAPDGSLWVTTSNRDGRGDPRSDDDRVVRLSPAALAG